eukprot:5474785-Pyramimonas_sp.AAC.1
MPRALRSARRDDPWATDDASQECPRDSANEKPGASVVIDATFAYAHRWMVGMNSQPNMPGKE